MIAVSVTVNGRAYAEEIEPRLLLADFLRGRLGLRLRAVPADDVVAGVVQPPGDAGAHRAEAGEADARDLARQCPSLVSRAAFSTASTIPR